MTRWLGLAMTVGLLLAYSSACSSKEKDAQLECAPGVAPATIQRCTCPDMVTMGNQTCLASGTFTSCSCPAPLGGTGGAGGTGGTPPVTTGGSGGSVGGSGGTGGLGGTGGTGGGGTGGVGGTGGSDEDAGDTLDAGMDAGMDSGTEPAEGEQNSPCPNGNECNSDLACYIDNHCTATCTDDNDCDALQGADYTCYTMDGLCRVICTDEMDCPAGFECQNVSMGGGMTLRCVLP